MSSFIVADDDWMDELRFDALFNSISLILGCQMKGYVYWNPVCSGKQIRFQLGSKPGPPDLTTEMPGLHKP